MRLGMFAWVWAAGWSAQDFQTTIRSTAQAGFDVIEIPIFDPGAIDVANTRGVLEEHGVEPVCGVVLSPSTDVSSDDPAAVLAGRRLLGEALKTTVGLGSTYLGGVPYTGVGFEGGPEGRAGRPATQATTRGRTNAVDAIRELCRHAASEGVTIGLEVINRYETGFFNTAEEALAFVADVGEPNLGIHLDTYHMNLEESGFAAPVEMARDRLVYVHISESHRGYLGTGTVDFPAFFGALARTGYDGILTVESFSPAVLSPAIAHAVRAWRELWDDGMDFAVSAREFINVQRAVAIRTLA